MLSGILSIIIKHSIRMPIPPFTIDGVLPPYVGSNPGLAPSQMSPYEVTPLEIVDYFASSADRCTILEGWLSHRADLRSAGVIRGFQWLDGSFVEKKNPNDVDVVTFFRRPIGVPLPALAATNPFNRSFVKTTFRVDALFVDLDGTAEAVVRLTRYYCGLFSHRRSDFVWKGMLATTLDNPQLDTVASSHLKQKAAAFSNPQNSP